MNKGIIRFFSAILSIVMLSGMVLTVEAAPKTMPDGGVFDAQYYATQYPDVAAVFGTDENMLYMHYTLCGKAEGRLPYNPVATAPVANNDAAYAAAVNATLKPTDSTYFELKTALPAIKYYTTGKRSGFFFTMDEEGNVLNVFKAGQIIISKFVSPFSDNSYIGVLGPTRQNYFRVMSLVKYAGKMLEETL